MSEKNSDPGAWGILIGAIFFIGFAKWFGDVVWPVLKWWLWVGGITAAIWLPFLWGVYLKSSRGGYQFELAQKAQSITASLLIFFFLWSLGPHETFYSASYLGKVLGSLVAALAVFGIAMGVERVTVSGIRRVRRWIEQEKLKGRKSEEQARASEEQAKPSGKKTGSDNSKRHSRPGSATDDVASALDVLGLKEPFSLDELNARRKKLLAQTHPDAGGSANLFRQVQSAYELLKSRL